MKRLLLLLSSLLFALRAGAALFPYAETLARADAAAIVTITACEETLRDGLIYSSATLVVDTPILGIKQGETFKVPFGLPQQPPKRTKEGGYSRTTQLASEIFLFQVADRYLVLLEKQKGRWVVTRGSMIVDDVIGDGYFEDFAKTPDVSIGQAIELIKAHRKAAKAKR